MVKQTLGIVMVVPVGVFSIYLQGVLIDSENQSQNGWITDSDNQSQNGNRLTDSENQSQNGNRLTDSDNQSQHGWAWWIKKNFNIHAKSIDNRLLT